MDVDGNQETNNTTIEIDELDAPASEPPRKRARIQWISVKQKKEGRLCFLGSNNLKDLYLLRQLMTTPPWEAGFGNITGAWEEVAKALCKHKDSHGKPVYGETIKDKHVKDRFKTLMDFCNHSISDNSFRSGCDDEEPPTEIQNLMEQVHEMHTSYLVEEKASSERKKNQVKRNREQAKVIRDAAMGNANRKVIIELSGADHGSTTVKNKAASILEDLDLAGLIECAKTILSPVSTDSAFSDQADF